VTAVAVPDDAAPGRAARGAVALSDMERSLRTIAATITVGLGLGFLVGGIGGRVAMRLLFLTSDPSVRGMISDDGFPIGRFDLEATLNLLVVGTVLGVIGAFVYLGVRPFLMGPRWLQRAGCAIGGGAVVGSMLVHVEGVDFTRLGPRWFAIALFVALPAIFGYLAAVAVEWASRPDGWFMTAPRGRALTPLVTFLFLPLALVLGPPIVVVLAARRAARGVGWVGRALHHPAALWIGRGLWLTAGLVGAWTLALDSAELLT
jgi:hypothetical protein